MVLVDGWTYVSLVQKVETRVSRLPTSDLASKFSVRFFKETPSAKLARGLSKVKAPS